MRSLNNQLVPFWALAFGFQEPGTAGVSLSHGLPFGSELLSICKGAWGRNAYFFPQEQARIRERRTND